LYRVDETSGSVQKVSNAHANGVALATADHVYVATLDGSLLSIDLPSQRSDVLARLSAGQSDNESPEGMTFAFGRLWVVEFEADGAVVRMQVTA
jgi:sugar lactone lactonase YvrE